jgi:hypothetical protein
MANNWVHCVGIAHPAREKSIQVMHANKNGKILCEMIIINDILYGKSHLRVPYYSSN